MKTWLILGIGIVLGTLGGYLYWFYIGCVSGTCAITSSPVNSSLYGGLMGGLFFNLFQTPKQKNSENKKG
ncbi:MAG TPA: DUF6132 family protein [Chryseolinea sp.]|nr:DUF6132 family protein [Chryseolinea sp.]HPM29993.1 DUF6132 family protein [Chryseolinea sp.]